ncbi:YbaN family protein [Abyssibius alkaniclasticus]|uniref:YbaN family protein n=1 Tax=Abyssibius alkaniclasticus TaxID=2881234 RepID=UPI0040596C06
MNSVRHGMWLAIGLVFTGFGLVGAVLPIIPTVPFLIVAAFAFSRSSKRFHNWLVNHRIFGPPIRDWQESGAISRRTKWIATLTMSAGIGVSFLAQLSWIIIIIQSVAIVVACLFIWTRPDTKPR